MKKPTAVIAALFAAASMGVSTIVVAAESNPVNPLDTAAMPQLPQRQMPQAQVPQPAQPQWQPQVQVQPPALGYGQPISPPVTEQPGAQRPQASAVIVNDVPLSTDTVAALRASGLNVVDGNYWYDRTSGFYGYKGGPAAGMISAGLNLGGPLKPDCSNGTSGFFVNGRQLTIPEAAALVRTLHAPQARYALDADMNFGFEGRPPAFNLRQLAMQAQQQQEPQQQHKSLSERGMLYTPPVVVPGVGASGDGFSYSHD
jgi:hypothetical protein